jgi:hypothetical protein
VTLILHDPDNSMYIIQNWKMLSNAPSSYYRYDNLHIYEYVYDYKDKHDRHHYKFLNQREDRLQIQVKKKII